MPMLSEKLRAAASLGEADRYAIASLSEELESHPLARDIHTVRLTAGFRPENPLYFGVARLLGTLLEPLADTGVYVAETVEAYGGTAVIKHGAVQSKHRQDEMDWHVDIRKALILSSISGTEVLTDQGTTILPPYLSSWLEAVKAREEVHHPSDTELIQQGLSIDPLATHNWYELGHDVVHRAPENTGSQPVQRLFIGVTPPYFLR